jgi:hypothetical protein
MKYNFRKLINFYGWSAIMRYYKIFTRVTAGLKKFRFRFLVGFYRKKTYKWNKTQHTNFL